MGFKCNLIILLLIGMCSGHDKSRLRDVGWSDRMCIIYYINQYRIMQ